MPDKAYQELAQKFGLNWTIIKSWYELAGLDSFEDWEKFFQENIDFIKAKPFVKWVGGKRQLISQLEKFFPDEFNNYLEPFVWGGAVFFRVQKKKSFLSDVNSELINAYEVIKYYPEKLINFLSTLEFTRECFYRIRSWDKESNWQSKYTKIQRAGRLLYLNRTCFNWLYRENARGEFNVPIWRYKNPDFVQAENIRNCSKLLNKTEAIIKQQSFEKVVDNAQAGDFVYFDPPYDVLSETANFTSYNEWGFGKEWQKKLAEVFKQLDANDVKVMLSNHDTPLIRELYQWFRFEIVKARRSVNSNSSKRGAINEVVVLNY